MVIKATRNINFSAIIIFSILGGCQTIPEDKPLPKQWNEKERELLLTELERTRKELLRQIDTLNERQWFFRSDSQSWSLAEVVEHLDLQENMHYREVYIISQTPTNLELLGKTKKNDSLVSAYATDPQKGVADWYVQPLGRWCDKRSAVTQFNRTRDKMLEFVKTTDADLRMQFTYRKKVPKNDFRRVRDLHQIILTTIAHTKRHIHQIERIKVHPDFPAN
ncbi:MAG: DinB family protein [Bacteroidetes bacterium]|nr:DinB family protein [Bacteroidota bacterium]